MEFIVKAIIVILLLSIIFNLFKAMFTMLKGDKKAPPMSHFIGRRLLFTGALMVLLLILLALGIIEPNPSPYSKG
ncbi:DUF2909 domain-containing protein [Psychrosphaera sp.]|nr:DUF2909 domain-containing protein [Psychrosphaera sp.]